MLRADEISAHMGLFTRPTAHRAHGNRAHFQKYARQLLTPHDADWIGKMMGGTIPAGSKGTRNTH